MPERPDQNLTGLNQRQVTDTTVMLLMGIQGIDQAFLNDSQPPGHRVYAPRFCVGKKGHASRVHMLGDN